MTDESRMVRDLLDANLKLTDQFLELAKLAIGAPAVGHVPASTYVESNPAPSPEFELSTADDWEDIPDAPLGQGAQILEIPRRLPEDAIDDSLPLSMSEEEEDLRHDVAFGLKPTTELSDFLRRLGAPGHDIAVEFGTPVTAPES